MTDAEYMNRALGLAARGRGWVEPNPMVGAVVVRDGTIVGEGWHERFGQAHAEVQALLEADELARGATLYVTLEPCSHFGKTPPCTEAVIRAGVRRVVAAMIDPFPKVSGQGASLLKESGIAFEVGVGEVAARELNAPYLTRLRENRPWIHAKWAMTLDGKIATRNGESKWITGEPARARVHQLRGRMDAITVGAGTLRLDDPSLTVRPPGARIPTRIVIASGKSPLAADCQLLRTVDDAPVMLVLPENRVDLGDGWKSRGAEVLGVPATGDRLNLRRFLAILAGRGMTNLLAEGGSGLLGSFVDERLVDEVHAFIAPKLLGGSDAISAVGGNGIGAMSDVLRLSDVTTELLGDDLYVHGRYRTIGQI